MPKTGKILLKVITPFVCYAEKRQKQMSLLC